jgi:hypothetical protein
MRMTAAMSVRWGKWLLNYVKSQVYIYIGRRLGFPPHIGPNPPNTHRQSP